MNTITYPLRVPQILTNIYITDGTASNHWYYRNRYKCQKSHENAEIGLFFCKLGYYIIKTVEFAESHPINIDTTMHVTGTIFDLLIFFLL